MIFAVAVLLNFVWEMAQFPLFDWHGSWFQAARLGLRASISDGALVSFIYIVGCVLFQRRDWHLRPGVRGYGFAILVGATWAIVVEWLALKNGRWMYGPLMPRFGWLGGVGLLPVAQMIVLPALIFRIVARLQRH